jgi:hypothetical protein
MRCNLLEELTAIDDNWFRHLTTYHTIMLDNILTAT